MLKVYKTTMCIYQINGSTAYSMEILFLEVTNLVGNSQKFHGEEVSQALPGIEIPDG